MYHTYPEVSYESSRHDLSWPRNPRRNRQREICTPRIRWWDPQGAAKEMLSPSHWLAEIPNKSASKYEMAIRKRGMLH